MTYPFGAVVGMDDMRLALLLNAVSPAVGGVLVRGEKGTAKSTTVRALAAVLPPVDVVAGCRFACDPAAPDPACPDGPHDPGAPGHTRAARLLLVGTMNPEEGELRPQLLDRFGLTVEVAAPRDPAERAEVVRRRFAHDADPAGFAASWAGEEAGLARRIAEARARLPHVVLSDHALRQVTAVCAAFDVDGLRADLVTARAAIAHAAWCARDEVTEDDVRVAARLALPRRPARPATAVPSRRPTAAPGRRRPPRHPAARTAAPPGPARPPTALRSR